MATRYHCDRCDRISAEPYDQLVVTAANQRDPDYSDVLRRADLCGPCLRDVAQLLDTRPPEAP